MQQRQDKINSRKTSVAAITVLLGITLLAIALTGIKEFFVGIIAAALGPATITAILLLTACKNGTSP